MDHHDSYAIYQCEDSEEYDLLTWPEQMRSLFWFTEKYNHSSIVDKRKYLLKQ